MRSITTALALLASLAFLPGCTASPTPPAPVAAPETARTTPSGPVTGFVGAYGNHAWRGLPFAAPPVGELRWQPPRPATTWAQNRVALAHGTPCLQFGSPLGGVGEPGSQQGSEDCLYLDVYAPAMAAGEVAAAKLPVMLWIHGGGNTIGHAGFFDGGHLAQSQRVVVVVIQYRLGPFGWFLLPRGKDGELPADADVAARVAASGNWGTLDSIAALRWVQSSIAAFGGDPGNVTVFGESAGGTNTLALLLSPQAEGLFHRAIVQSGGLGLASVAEGANRRDASSADGGAGSEVSSGEILLKLLVSEGRAADAAAARAQADAMSAAEIAAFLRALPPWRFYAAYQGPGLLGPNSPAVFQDGTVIRQGEPLALLADPATHIDVPTLLGTNRDEPKIFMAFDPANVVRLAGIPLWLKDAEAYDRDARYGALSWKLRGVDEIASRLAAHGAPAYAYRWDWDEQGTRFGIVDLSRILGAAHGLEIPFVFGHFDIGPQSGLLFTDDGAEARTALSGAMMSWWANFAATGAPGRGRDGSLPEWQPWQADAAARGPTMMLLDTPAGGGTRMSTERVTRESLLQAMEAEPGDDAARCALFRRTFRFDRDAWTEAAWKTFAGGRCAAATAGTPE